MLYLKYIAYGIMSFGCEENVRGREGADTCQKKPPLRDSLKSIMASETIFAKESPVKHYAHI